MQLTMTVKNDKEEDGFTGSVTMVRSDIDDLYSLGRAYGDFTRSIGFSYVEDVAFEKDDGQMVFGGF